MSLDRFYNISATVIQWTETFTEVGVNEMPTTYSSVLNILCSMQVLSKNERFIDGTDRIIGTHRAFTTVNTIIQQNHHILIGTDEYDIKSIENPMEMDDHYEIILERVT